jgi:DNA ligase D-like protein (predicted ligase)
MAKRNLASGRSKTSLHAPPHWVAPQLALLVKEPPTSSEWLHEIKYDGYRLHARLDAGDVRLLTRSGLDWTHKYRSVAKALGRLRVTNAYVDGELCALRSDGTTSFSSLQAASDGGSSQSLAYFAFDLLFLDGRNLSKQSLAERKAALQGVLGEPNETVRFSDHIQADGRRFHRAACEMNAEGIISKRSDAFYAPGDRGLWRKTKCLNREEFVIVGFTDPEGSRPHLGSLLLAYYTDDGRLVYGGRGGGGISSAELGRLHTRLKPLVIPAMPVAVPPPRTSRFGSPLELSRVHWVRPVLVCEVRFLTWTADGLLRQVTYEGLREDKRATDVRRARPVAG